MSKKASLRVYLAVLVLSATIPLGLFAYTAVSVVIERQEDALDAAMVQRTDALAAAVERRLQVYLETLYGLADSHELRVGDWPRSMRSRSAAQPARGTGFGSF